MKYYLLKPNLLLKLTKTACCIMAALLLLSSVSYANSRRAHLAGLPNNSSKKVIPPIIIKGKVTDAATSESLIGVSIKVKNSGQGTVTDVNGNFSITAPDDAILTISYIGYAPIEVSVAGQSMLNVRLQSANKNLTEVIVVGYGTQKKVSTTAAVSSIDSKEIAQKPVVNLSNALIGRASGLIITQGSGEPGYDGAQINIRGLASIGGSNPLTIVDGVPRDFTRLDPNTIESISILKDAAAVAPYGVAGANGVILVTTKQGKSGAPTLSYNGYVGWQNPTKVPEFVTGYQYAQMRNQAQANDGNLPTYTAAEVQHFKDQDLPNQYGNGHPLDEIIKKNTLITYHNLSLTGGSDNIKYYVGLGYTHQDGMWTTTFLDKYNGTFNITANATKTTTVSLNVTSYLEDQHFPSQSAGTIIGQAERQAPWTPVYYTNGEWSGYIGQSLIGEIYHSGYQFNENPTTLTQFSIDQKLPLKGLSIKAVVSYDDNNSLQRKWVTPIPFYNVVAGSNPEVFNQGIQGASLPTFSENYYQTHNFTYQGIINYQNSFGKNDVSFLGVVEDKIQKYETFGAGRINYNLNIDELNYGGPQASDETNSGYSNGQKQLGYVYRLDYGYDKKYLLEASGRYDGSYLFAPGKRFGFFPAFSAGWRISEEKFIKDNFTWIDNLKLRASWGQSGAYPVVNNVIQTYNYLTPYNVYSPGAVINGSNTQGVYEALQGNPNITWEKSVKTDVGLEASLFKGVLSFEADYFYEKRSNMLLQPTNALPGEYGIPVGLLNAGILSNKGFELTVKSSHNFTNDLRLDVTGTFTYAKNKLLQDFETGAAYNNPNRRQTGRPLNTQFGLKAIGYFTAADFNPDGTLKAGIPVPTFGHVQAGDLQYADISGPNGKPDGVIDANDQTVIGHPNTPEIIYGLEPRLSYKNFDLDLLFQGTGLSDLYLNGVFVQPFQASGSATELSYTQSWTPQNPNALYPRLSGTPTVNNTQGSSWWIRNDSYIRLKSAEIGYTFSNKMLHNKIKSVRIFVAGQNLFTWTPSIKETIDPEENSGNSNYFQQRVISVGANATF